MCFLASTPRPIRNQAWSMQDWPACWTARDSTCNMSESKPEEHEENDSKKLHIVKSSPDETEGLPPRPKPPSADHGPPSAVQFERPRTVLITLVLSIWLVLLIGFCGFAVNAARHSEDGLIIISSFSIVLLFRIVFVLHRSVLRLEGISINTKFSLVTLFRACGKGFDKIADYLERKGAS